MLLKRMTGVVTNPRACAASAMVDGNGRSPEIMRSAPSKRLACCVSPPFTRSAKNPTVPTLPTASTSAATRTRSSPARQSRRNKRNARRSVFMVRRLAISSLRSSPTSRPAASDSRRPHLVARLTSCVTSTSVVPCSRLSRNMRSATLDTCGTVEVAGRFVRHQQLGFACKCARNRHALLFTTRQLARIVSRPLAQADAIKPCTCADLRVIAPASSRGSMTFSNAVSAGSNWNDWNTKPSNVDAWRPTRLHQVRKVPRRRCESLRTSVGRGRPANRAAWSCRSPTRRRLRLTHPVPRRRSRRREWSAARRRSGRSWSVLRHG